MLMSPVTSESILQRVLARWLARWLAHLVAAEDPSPDLCEGNHQEEAEPEDH